MSAPPVVPPPIVQPPAEPPAPSPFVGLSCSGAAGSGWCAQLPRPATFDVHDIYFVDPLRGWAAADNGTVLRTEDGGSSWTGVSLGPKARVTWVRFADALRGWALVPTENRVFRTVDGGRTWTPGGEGPSLYPTTVTPYGRLLVMTGLTFSGRFLTGATVVSEDGGISWRLPDVSDGWFVSGTGTVWNRRWERSVDGGRTFQRPASLPTVMSGEILGVDGPSVWGTTTDANSVQTMWWSDDGGDTWRSWPIEAPAGIARRTVDLTRLFADGRGWGRIMDSNGSVAWAHTTDRGRTWRPVSVDANVPIGSLGGQGVVDSLTWWYLTDAESRITRDGGRTFDAFDPPEWRLQAAPGALPERSVFRDPTGALVARFGERSGGGAMRSIDNGRTWVRLPGASRATDPEVTGLRWLSANTGLALLADGTVLRTGDAGIQWSAGRRLGAGTTRADGLGRIEGLVWLKDSDGALRRSTDGGETWQVVAVPLRAGETLTAATFFTTRDGLVTTSACRLEGPPGTAAVPLCRVGTLATQDGGLNWQRRKDAEDNAVGLVAYRSMPRGVRTLQSGGLEWSDDGGAQWTPAVATSVDTTGISRVVWVTDTLVWATRSYGLLLSRDAGRTWTAIDPGLPKGPGPFHFASIRNLAFADPQHGWLVGAEGTVMATVDGGATWQLQAAPTLQSLGEVDAWDAQRVWIGGTRGVVLATARGGR